MNQALNRMDFGGRAPEEMLDVAREADRQGDVYTAVKILRKLIRTQPAWVPPYWELSQIYKRRMEWKPVIHYAFCVLDRESDRREAWQDLGLAATAIGKLKTAKLAWQKLEYAHLLRSESRDTIALSLQSDQGTEVVMAERLDPVRGRVISVPQPSSGFRFDDVLLFDLRSPDKVVVGDKSFPVFRGLERLKMAHTQTFSAILHTSDRKKLDFLRKLCRDRGLGFDNWSKAERQTSWERPEGMEFYRELQQDPESIAFSIVALAGRKSTTALEVLRAWKQITLVDYNRLFRLG
ncbi:MAG: hypothetical protein GYB31_04575 [Bacteroidetes bacterium]|nr:hypothetical protein [Bacteroidota bacterium]